MEKQSEIIIFVHGTFPSSKERVGDDWWQQNSPFWNYLKGKLPGNFVLNQDITINTWEGSNSQKARSFAAEDLLGKLRGYEYKKIHYHIIAHSHGGSIVWETLLKSIEEEEGRFLNIDRLPKYKKSFGLKYLRSWTTIGTSFLMIDSYSLPLLQSFEFLLSFTTFAMVLSGVFLIVVSFSVSAVYSIFFESFFVLITFLFLAVIMTLVTTKASISKTLSCYKQENLNKTFLIYADRWIGILSPDDEAFNGLTISSEFDMELFGKLSVSKDLLRLKSHTRIDHGFFSQRIDFLYCRLGEIFYNNCVKPINEKIFRNFLIKLSQGIDLPGASVSSISSTPIENLGVIPFLPKAISQELTQAANKASKNSVPMLRKSLGQALYTPGFIAFFEKFKSSFSGNELIHSNYFDNPTVREIIATSILMSSNCHAAKIPSLNVNLKWINNFTEWRESIQKTIFPLIKVDTRIDIWLSLITDLFLIFITKLLPPIIIIFMAIFILSPF